jgi:hypothetical protein
MEDLASVFESPELDLMDGGWIKVNGPPWGLVARRWWQNDRDFEWRVRERENSDEVVCSGSGTVVFRGFQRYIEPLKTIKGREKIEKDKARYSSKNTSSARKKIRCGKKKSLR